ncbi:hypothetical protein [Chitinophaga sp. Cy-1792]|uniref:hypothetical protein n=1 Tax=Chitinophaga sp. Cy-1792 TaxID=2608339 RepID=UPI001422B0B4|nr:hypothetical protein [Chitinophaga sp. Cy-1792]NIG53729.1 hypothetical protein [Chitinophaga sp. Cy-1792]
MEKQFLKLPLSPGQASGLEYTNIQTSISGFIQSLTSTAPGEFKPDKAFGWHHSVQPYTESQWNNIPELLTAIQRYEKRINKIKIVPLNINGQITLELNCWIISLNNHHIAHILLQLNLIK